MMLHFCYFLCIVHSTFLRPKIIILSQHSRASKAKKGKKGLGCECSAVVTVYYFDSVNIKHTDTVFIDTLSLQIHCSVSLHYIQSKIKLNIGLYTVLFHKVDTCTVPKLQSEFKKS